MYTNESAVSVHSYGNFFGNILLMFMIKYAIIYKTTVNGDIMDKFAVLKEYFGHDTFRNGQSEIIDAILSGRDALGIMPTGAGKSVCYQIPAMLARGTTLVVSPLISLMKDQVNALVQSGIPAAYINSSLTLPQYREVLRKAEAGTYKILYVAPERLLNDDFIDFAQRITISMLTVDEAHCISQWGQDFRPSYRKIVDFLKWLPRRPVINAFTATATPKVRDDIIRILGLQNPFTVTTGFDRSNLYFGVKRPKKKYDELKELLSKYRGKCGVVYCISRRNVEEVCEKLNNDGFSATRYHAGLTDSERHANQDDFIYDRKQIMVATNAFGMGIDKSNVSFVIHYNMPKNIESYYQEAGRAGRDGEPADCILLYSGSDVRTNRFLIENSKEYNEELSEQELDIIYKQDMKRLKDMTIYCTTTGCLREYILKYFGETSKNFCGNCSSCLTGFETVDITVDAQKIVSCVYRIHQKGPYFGRQMIADILHGSKNEKLLRLEFDTLSTYSIMKETSISRIRAILDFIIDEGYLDVDDEHSTVKLNNRSAEILRDRKQLSMKLPAEEKEKSKEKSEKMYYDNNTLFQELKKLRTRLAAEENVPAYIIFSDAALKDMCRKLPKNYSQFLEVSGVGKVKAEKYAEAFCEVIAEYAEPIKTAPSGEVSYLERELDSYRGHTVAKGKNLLSYRKWSEDEQRQLLNELRQGLTMEEISRLHNRDISAITDKLRKMNNQ